MGNLFDFSEFIYKIGIIADIWQGGRDHGNGTSKWKKYSIRLSFFPPLETVGLTHRVTDLRRKVSGLQINSTNGELKSS